MVAMLPWTGGTLSAEQEFARLAYALAEVLSPKELVLDNYTPPSKEPYLTISQGLYQFTTTPQKNHVIVVATLPLLGDYARRGGKPWQNIAELSTDAIPAGFGSP
jgi:hypothetical protein